MVNWRGAKDVTTNFNADVTTIMGANGLGKSRHFDAFIWLLFGKDSKDRKDFEIKSNDAEGNPLQKCECSVTGVLSVDGETITLKRAFVEDWVKPKGQTEQVFKGNHTECWFNETPVRVGDYQNRIREIIDETVFKMITNPAFFIGMPWKNQREQLFLLAGTITDAEIASNNPDFAALLDRISGKSLADFKTELAARKKRLRIELDNIQPRIDQTQRMMPESADWAALEAEIERCNIREMEINALLSDRAAANRAFYEAEQAKQAEISKLKMQRQEEIRKAEQAAKDSAFTANAERREKMASRSSKSRLLDLTRNEIAGNKKEIARLEAEITRIKGEQDKLREDWQTENARAFDESATVCPYCGQPLPADRVEESRKHFNDAKDKKLANITAQGQKMGKEIEELEKVLAKVRKATAEIESQEKATTDFIEECDKFIAAHPEVTPATIDGGNLEPVIDIDKQIADIKATISTDNAGDYNQELVKELQDIRDKRGQAQLRLSCRDQIKKCNEEIERLEKTGKDLAQQIADAEKEEYTVAQFTKTKIDECERRINGMFTMVKFRLFDYTIDGNEFETCVPLIDGTPFQVANTAKQVNAGLDIINALCKFNGVCAPIFIDNRESVNELIPTESQIINLVVTTDKELVIK
jgi:DNA repair exonuclease SbcCD ATPase subunit